MSAPVSPATAPTVADALVEQLGRAGVRTVFGFPGGGSNLDLIDALGRAGIAFVLTRTEGSAAFMAAATAELTGVPGVVVVGNGPGLASVVNGAAHAHLDRVALIVISDRYTDAERRTTGHQILDQVGLLAPVVKWSATLDATAPGQTMARALAIANAAPRGAVHLEIPRTIAGEPAAAADPAAEPEPAHAPATGDLSALVAALRTAAHPALLLGLEANDADPGDVRRLAERLGAPVLATYKAKGVFPEDHPLWAGILTGGAVEAPLLEQSDTLLAVGLDPTELLTKPWPYAAPVLALRTCDAGLDYLRPQVSAIGPLGVAVEQVAGALTPEDGPRWDPAAIAAHRDGVLGRLRVQPRTGLAASEVVETLAAGAPDDTVLCVDAGAHMFAATTFWPSRRPRRFLISNGLATMGFAVPAAIAAAQAGVAEAAVAVTGDGGMAYNLLELETAARCAIPVVVVVIDDASLSLIRIKHEARGRPRRPLDFGAIRFAEIATATGAAGHVAATAEELRTAFTLALAHPGPTLIHMRTSGDEYGELLTRIRG